MLIFVFFFLRQECLGMPELQRAAEFFFQLEAFWNEKKQKGQHVELLKSCPHASLLVVHSSCSTKFWKRPLYCTTITVLQLVLNLVTAAATAARATAEQHSLASFLELMELMELMPLHIKADPRKRPNQEEALNLDLIWFRENIIGKPAGPFSRKEERR